MHKIKPSEIIVVLRYGNVAEARRMYQLCNVPYNKAQHITRLILHENDPELYALADQAKLLHINSAICDEAAGMNLSVLRQCIKTATRQYGEVSKCVTANAASMAAKKGAIDVLQYLLDNDCPIDWNASIEAIKADRLDVYQWLEENAPGRIHHSFGFRHKTPTFQIQKYLYEKGYRPMAQDFRMAIKLGDYPYAQWLFEIGCPEAYEPISEPPPDQMILMLKNNLNIDDFKWLTVVINNKRLPDIELTTETSFYEYFPALTQYLVDHNHHCSLQYLFEYIGKNAVWIVDTCFKQLTQQCLLMIDEQKVECVTQNSSDCATNTGDLSKNGEKTVEVQIDNPIKNTDASADGPVKNTEASADGPVKNTEASAEGSVKNTEASTEGPVKNTEASTEGPVKNTEVSVDGTVKNEGGSTDGPIKNDEAVPISSGQKTLIESNKNTFTEQMTKYQNILIDFVRYTDPNPLQLAVMYLYLTQLSELSLHSVVEYVEHNISWKHVFLVAFNQSDQSLSIVKIIDHLWDQYRNKLVSLTDLDRCKEWDELKNQDPSADQIYAFIGAILDL
jgi:hypothetical protein